MGVYRNNGNMVGKTYEVYDQALNTTGCTEVSTGGISATCDDQVHITGGHVDNKYVIAHEVGHAMQWKKQGNADPNFNYDSTDETAQCEHSGSHGMVSVEYQSAAALEGMAHYFAASAFNDPSSSECWFRYYKNTDWDGDSTLELAGWIDCETNDHCDNSGESCGPIAIADHFGNECSPGVTVNRALEFDWLRFWWDLNTDEGVAFDEAMDIWEDAHPETWAATDTIWIWDRPGARLRDAANANSLLTEWDARDNSNGVHR
jgi:hypothetical protein